MESQREREAERIIARWRKLFLGIYLAFVIAAILVVLVSILAVHAGAYEVPVGGRRISQTASNPQELRDCHRRLSRLLSDLHQETFTLIARAQRFATDPATEWANWSRGWRHRWKVLDYRCRLSQLSGNGVSTEIDKMADIHAALDELYISYTGVVSTFADRYVDRLRGLERELQTVRAMIDRRRSSHSGASQ